MSEILDELEEDTQKDKYLTFGLDEEEFGIEIEYVREIIGIQPISEIPEIPSFIRGIINLRGQIIPVIDIRARFKKEVLDYNDRTCIIVVDIKDIAIGLIVDKVLEVLNIPEENLVPPPDYKTGIQNGYIKMIGKSGDGVKLIIDCEQLLGEAEIELIEDLD
ncbi:chemotaxis protein CheW [Andreesenia angusta]|uniref:Chemotaxis protein CheW n=1 Tax=Andreesenia angusta TaxID=39480 RepID=A0A1S1VA07_9FIRM|nr:chemotaxis protein CheW [Andreesenia angusta]OHW63250.1 chemotaxis protein CheW [Andreesenia angusta]